MAINQINNQDIYALSASYALTAETLLGSVTSASYALSSSYALTASYANGALQAVSSSAVKIANNTTTDATYYPTFVSQTSGTTELQVDSNTLTWNPSTNTLTALFFAGNATTATNAQSATSASYALNSTNAASATTATNATNVAVTDTTSGTGYYVAFVGGTSGNQPIRVDSNGLLFNATTNTLSTTSSYTLTSSFITPLNQSVIITGSVSGNVISASVISSTASLDLNLGNFFFVQINNSSTTHINPTNIKPGQTINIRIQQAAGVAGAITWPATVKQPSGSGYSPTTALSAYDIVSLISFDTTNLYLSYVKRLI